jgi:hypothetical protein
MSYIITALISAMVGGAVGLFIGCACAVSGKADEMEEKRND